MIIGAHLVLFSADAEADRIFFRDVLGLRCVDAGGGWLLFGLPPAEVAVHPLGAEQIASPAGGGMMGGAFYLMCDDLAGYVVLLKGKGVRVGELDRQRWGVSTTIQLPSGGRIGVYQPAHPTAVGVG